MSTDGQLITRETSAVRSLPYLGGYGGLVAVVNAQRDAERVVKVGKRSDRNRSQCGEGGWVT